MDLRRGQRDEIFYPTYYPPERTTENVLSLLLEGADCRNKLTINCNVTNLCLVRTTNAKKKYPYFDGIFN